MTKTTVLNLILLCLTLGNAAVTVWGWRSYRAHEKFRAENRKTWAELRAQFDTQLKTLNEMIEEVRPRGTYIFAASLSQSDIQAAIDRASPGDWIILPVVEGEAK